MLQIIDAVETRQRQTVHVQRRAQGGVNIGKALPQSGMRADYQTFVAAKAEREAGAARPGPKRAAKPRFFHETSGRMVWNAQHFKLKMVYT